MNKLQYTGRNDCKAEQEMPQRESSATYVITRAHAIERRASELVDAAHEKLLAVTVPATPDVVNLCKSVDEARGPLFVTLLASLATTETALREIEDTLRRVDL